MTYSSNHSMFAERILSTYIKCRIHSFPIDCFAILKQYGFRIFTYTDLKQQNIQLYELAISYSGDSFTVGDIIAYNEKQSAQRISFSLMHEFGHFVLGHEGEDQENENEADEFASHILAPRIVMHKYMVKNADQIHDKFGLSYAASNRALTSYKNWYNSICHSTKKPSRPEKELELLLFPVQIVSKKDNKGSNLLQKTEDCILFLDNFRRFQSDSCAFAKMEQQWLYGNDMY